MNDIIDGEGERWIWGVGEDGDEGYFYPGPGYYGAIAHTEDDIRNQYGIGGDQFVVVWADADTGTVKRAEGPMTESSAFERRSELWDNSIASSVEIIQHVTKGNS